MTPQAKANARTMTLADFRAQYAATAYWYAGVGSPAGTELRVETDTECDEDYCDGQQLAESLDEIVRSEGDWEGAVTRDSDGEYRWEVGSLSDVDLRDCGGNTIYNLVVWGE